MTRSIIVIVCFSTSIAQAQLSLRPVALDGQNAPGYSVNFSGLYNNGPGWWLASPSINNSGQAVFANYSSLSGRTPSGYWSEGTGPLTLIGNFGISLYAPQIDDAGEAIVTGSNGLDFGVFRTKAQFTPAALISPQPTPGSNPPTSFAQIGNEPQVAMRPAVNRTGYLASYGQFAQSGPNQFGIFVQDPFGSNRVPVRANMPAPGTSSNFSFLFGLNSQTGGSEAVVVAPAVNQNGKVAFVATAGASRGVWSETSSGLGLVALGGTPAPGISPAASFSAFSDWLSMNSSGAVAFRAKVSPDVGLPTNYFSGIWSSGMGGTHLVAKRNMNLPGMAPGEYISRIGVPAISESGQTLFTGSIKGPGVPDNTWGIWVEKRQGLISMLVRSGSQIPGMPPGTNFSGVRSGAGPNYAGVIGSESEVGIPLINAENYVVFGSTQGIWKADFDGNISPIIRPNDFVLVNNQQRRVNSVVLSCMGGNGNDGVPTCLNDSGQLSLIADVEGVGRGFFVLSVPEPDSIALLLFASIPLYSYRRQRFHS